LTFVLRREADQTTLEVAGEIDLSSRSALRTAVLDALRQAPDGVTLDMSRVTFLDGGGIDELLACSSRARLHDKQLRVVNPSRPVARLLQLTGTDRLLREGSTRAAERRLRLAAGRSARLHSER
jgi:anti-anti-sigma factor